MSELAKRLEKYVELEPVTDEDCPDAHRVVLRVEQQSFWVGPFPAEDKESAEWMKDMLCVALAKIVEKERK